MPRWQKLRPNFSTKINKTNLAVQVAQASFQACAANVPASRTSAAFVQFTDSLFSRHPLRKEHQTQPWTECSEEHHISQFLEVRDLEDITCDDKRVTFQDLILFLLPSCKLNGCKMKNTGAFWFPRFKVQALN